MFTTNCAASFLDPPPFDASVPRSVSGQIKLDITVPSGGTSKDPGAISPFGYLLGEFSSIYTDLRYILLTWICSRSSFHRKLETYVKVLEIRTAQVVQICSAIVCRWK